MAAKRIISTVLLAVSLHSTSSAAPIKDMQKSHWASVAVKAVVDRGVLDAPNGKFNGNGTVTRTELAVTLAKYAKSLEQKRWNDITSKPLPKSKELGVNAVKPVTRYELASALTQMAGFIVKGLPTPTGKVFGASEALGEPAKLTGVSKTNPAYSSLEYLTKNRMIWGNSVLLKSGAQPITAKQLADSMTSLIAGLNDRLTDEPQNRETDVKPMPKK